MKMYKWIETSKQFCKLLWIRVSSECHKCKLKFICKIIIIIIFKKGFILLRRLHKIIVVVPDFFAKKICLHITLHYIVNTQYYHLYIMYSFLLMYSFLIPCRNNGNVGAGFI